MSDSAPEKIESNEGKEEIEEQKEEKKEEIEEQKEEKEEEVEEKKEEAEEKAENEEEEKSESSKGSGSESKESKGSKEKKEKDSEENEEDDDDDDDIDIDDEDEGNSDDYSEKEKKQKDPYHGYLNSKTEYKNFFYDVNTGDYLYGLKQNKFYKVMDYKNISNDKKAQIFRYQLKEIKTDTNNKKNNAKLNKNIQYMASIYGKAIEKDKKEKDNKDIDNKKSSNKIDSKNISEKIKEKKEEKKEEKNEETKEEKKEEKQEEKKEEKKEDKKEEKENIEQKEENKKEEPKNSEKESKKEDQSSKKTKDKPKSKKQEKDNEKNNDNPSKKKSKKKKKYDLNVIIKDFSEYIFFQKIRVIFLNSLNNPVVFSLRINMNTSIKVIIEHLSSLYHFKYDRYTNKMPLHIFINGKKHSVSNDTFRKFFIPTKFDYKNDYILILEKQTLKLKEYDLGRRCNYINFRGIEVPHVVYNSLYNFEIDSFIIIKDLEVLDCQVFELKKNIDLRQHTDNQYTIKRKLREFLDLNWRERTNFVTTFKSNKAKKSKDNYNANLFEINRKFVLLEGKMYIFLIKSNSKKVDAFIGRDICTEGIFIVSKGDKAILNGFRGKPISDFTAYS